MVAANLVTATQDLACIMFSHIKETKFELEANHGVLSSLNEMHVQLHDIF